MNNLKNLAERKGFEPLVPFWSTHTFQACALDQLGHLSVLNYHLHTERFKQK